MAQEIELLEKCVRLGATGLISVIATSALNYIRSMSQSINALNLNVARLLERSDFLEKAINLLSARIDKLESKKQGEKNE